MLMLMLMLMTFLSDPSQRSQHGALLIRDVQFCKRDSERPTIRRVERYKMDIKVCLLIKMTIRTMWENLRVQDHLLLVMDMSHLHPHQAKIHNLHHLFVGQRRLRTPMFPQIR